MVTVDARIEDEVARRSIKLNGRGPERYGPCPVCGGTDRFSINIKKQVWNCRHCAKGGDVIALVQHIDGADFKTAIRTLGAEDRPSPAARPEPPVSVPSPREDANGKRALALWYASRPIAGTLAMAYLANRGLAYADVYGDVLRFHPHCPFGGQVYPCMISLCRKISGNDPVAIHRTALTPDGRKIDRMTLGPISGAAIKLTDDPEVACGLHIGEGIETTLAAMALGFKPAWALGSAGAIRAFPVLAGIDALTILVDHDKPDQRGRQAGHVAARECGQRWKNAGCEVFYVLPDAFGGDMADLVTGAV
jgi:putative DNA primase/helicase